MSLADLGLIGNCQIAAHVHRDGAIVWSCLPRFDSEPVFASLLDPDRGGHFLIGAADGSTGTQAYLPNTNVLATTFTTPDGSFRVLDFAPRFPLYDRMFRPTKLVRIVEPLSGTPRVRVVCDPVLGWSGERPTRQYGSRQYGSHHIQFLGYRDELRLTTDIPLTYLDSDAFALTQPRHFVLSWGTPVEEPLEALCDRFLRSTVAYWQRWVKHCSIPALYQHEVIRSALTLKLHCFEDTGAIVAALTTSIPESPDSGRTWDYRYCWLRDAYYTLDAFRALGQFEEREQFLEFLLNIAASSPDLDLAPLYRLDGRTDLEERVLPEWRGYPGGRPVRVGNAAALHQQHDVFGEMVLALAPLFLDARFSDRASPQVLGLMRRLTKRALAVAGQPDAGIWEFREQWRPQTFSTLMCWAAADRMARIGKRHALPDAEEFALAASHVRTMIETHAIHPVRQCLVADFGGTEVDAALLQAVTLGLLPGDDARVHATLDVIRHDLNFHGWLKRYRTPDDFGEPEVAFMLCGFWMVEALARVGRDGEARAMLQQLAAIDAPLGLLAEDLDPTTGRMWGNYPQAYSHVGLINAAFAASPRWA